MKQYRIDLHNHSCLSPCGSLDMSPKSMAAKAKELGIEILGLSDHNSALNCRAFERACLDVGIVPLLGMEITTQEELHCLAFFESLELVLEMNHWVEERFQGFPNNPDKFGDQVYLDEDENILGEVELNLAQGACLCSLDELGMKIHSMDGLFIPAHVDRPSFSLISQLGFIPEDNYDALEAVNPQSLPSLPYRIIRGSDAHFLDDMGKRTTLIELETANFSSLRRALVDPSKKH